jgi:uncharacterized RDD family membrane protein YckC
MSHYGTPPPDDPDHQPDQPPQPEQPEQPPTGGSPAGDRAPYNPYPDDWATSHTGSESFTAHAPGEPPSPYPAPPPAYGQPSPYAPANPYATTGSPDKPTFAFGGYAGWFTRVGAYLIDSVAGAVAAAPVWIGYLFLLQGTTTTTNPDGTKTAHYDGSVALPIVLILLGLVTSLAFFVWNVCIRQGRTGATIGKNVLAIRLVNSDFQPIGPGWCFLRQLLHIVDSLPCNIGYLWPIWDAQKQTFADKIMSTYVIQATTPPPPPYA